MPKPRTTPVAITEYTPQFIYTPAGPFDLYPGDKIHLTLAVGGIGSGASISKVTIWADADGTKGTELGSWPADTTIFDNRVPIYEISGTSDGSVSIEDVESVPAGSEATYHFGATVISEGSTYNGDPVMVNKPH
ncbi:MAG: hypothetical protein OES32_17935 [Acidobacteriota bacterium]|nr:hypothetical protein [Acidobacteriota bacterium]